MASPPDGQVPHASQSLADAARPPTGRARSTRLDPRRRRIGYFMLVRLVVLSLFTVVAALLAWQTNREFSSFYHAFVWGTLVVGYALTILFARLLPRVRDLDAFAWVQTSTDIVIAAIVVQVSGGTDSGFVSLYLIAVLGAATMGGGRQTWAAAGACSLIYGTTSSLEVLGVLEPSSLGQPVPPLPPGEAVAVVTRTLVGLLGVTILSSFLNRQLQSSTIQVGDLRAMNENILRSLTSGLIGVDNRARVIYFNPAAASILGLDDDAIGVRASRLLPGVDDLLHPLSSASVDARRSPEPQELRVRNARGDRLHVRLSCSRLRDGQARRLGQLIEFQDVTRVHELAEKVRRGERLAAVGGLAASVAHEIRNPLAAISGSAELLDTASLQDEDERLLSIIRRESTRLSELITDMLAFTRPRVPQPVAVSLARVTTQAVEHFRADPSNTDVETTLHVAEIPDVELDPNQLSQVLWNLLRNAAEAMDGSGRIQVRVQRRADSNEAELVIADEGPGIEPERIERIFDPFFTTKERGTGFGLATVHRIVQDNGGSIELTSELGKGTTFRLRFDLGT
ncbi:MAG: ATP-binding protein [Myxococcota bacterium]